MLSIFPFSMRLLLALLLGAAIVSTLFILLAHLILRPVGNRLARRLTIEQGIKYI